MTDSQLFTLVMGIVFPVSCLIYQVGKVTSAINRLNDTMQFAKRRQSDSEIYR